MGAALGAYSSPVRSVLGSRDGINRPAGSPTAKDYVQDGLIAMWDGIENAGWGLHDSSPTAWKDLVGGNEISIVDGNQTVNYKSVIFTSTGAGGKLASQVWDIGSCEFCGTVTSSNSGSAIFSFNTLASSGFALNVLWHLNSTIGAGNRQKGYVFSRGVPMTMYSEFGSDGLFPKAMNGEIREPDGVTEYYSLNGNLFGFGFRNTNYPYSGTVYCLRVYSRALSESEIASNSSIDKVRFGI